MWECDNGGQLWTESEAAGYDNGTSFPSGFCASGFSSLYAAFVISLLVDLVFQVRDYTLQYALHSSQLIVPCPGLHALLELAILEALGALP